MRTLPAQPPGVPHNVALNPPSLTLRSSSSTQADQHHLRGLGQLQDTPEAPGLAAEVRGAPGGEEATAGPRVGKAHPRGDLRDRQGTSSQDRERARWHCYSHALGGALGHLFSVTYNYYYIYRSGAGESVNVNVSTFVLVSIRY